MFQQTAPALVSLATHDVATKEITTSLLNAEAMGNDKLKDFIKSRLLTRTISFYVSLPKSNSLTFKSLYMKKVVSKSSAITKVLKADRSLLQRLFRAQLSGRNINIKELLKHELFPVPLSIADTSGTLLSASGKSDLQHILEEGVIVNQLPSASDKMTCMVIDGQSFVVALGKPKGAKTFADLAKVFTKNVFNHAKDNCTRIDVVFDRYDKVSIKSSTRDKRRTGRRPVRRVIDNGDVPLPQNWSDFISLPENKSDLSCFLSNELLRLATDVDAEIVTAGGFLDKECAVSSTGRDVSLLRATHEEADTRILLHALEACLKGYERTIVLCRDTDVLVLLIHFLSKLSTEVWFQTGTFKQRNFIPVHNINLSHSEMEMLPAFHALTGCDTVSRLSGHSKKAAFKVFKKNTGLLTRLGHGDLSVEAIKDAETFICKLYSSDDNFTSTDELRCKLFVSGRCTLENLPPTSDAVELHIQRAHNQTAIWLLSLEAAPDLPTPIGNGWLESEGCLKPKLMRKDPVPICCIELLTCKCKSCSTTRCTCRRNKLKCVRACSCGSDSICLNPMNEDTESDAD